MLSKYPRSPPPIFLTHPAIPHLSPSPTPLSPPLFLRLSKYDFRAIAEKGRDLNNIRLLNGLSMIQKYKIKDTKDLVNLRAGGGGLGGREEGRVESTPHHPSSPILYRSGQYLFKKGDEITDFFLVLRCDCVFPRFSPIHLFHASTPLSHPYNELCMVQWHPPRSRCGSAR